MHADPVPMIATVAAMVGGLLVFALLLLAGGAVVRWLRLPQDLPDGPRFEPPPPALVQHPDRALAMACARRQSDAHALYARVKAATQTALECQLFAESLPAGQMAPEVAAALERGLAQARASYKAMLAALDDQSARMRQAPASDAVVTGATELLALCAREQQVASDALAQMRSSASGMVAPPRGTSRWLVIAAVILVLWLVALLALARW